MVSTRCMLAFLALAMTPFLRAEDELGAMWGTAAEEAKYYPIVNIPIPVGVPMRPGGLRFFRTDASQWAHAEAIFISSRAHLIRHQALNIICFQAVRMKPFHCRGKTAQ